MIAQVFKTGEIIPAKIIVSLIQAKMKSKGWEKAKFLIDGFPRNQNNLNGWVETVGDTVDAQGVIYIKCSQETMTKRIIKRGETSGRVDDNIEIIKKRLVSYTNESYPVIEKFKSSKLPFYELDGEKSAQEVNEECKLKLAHLLK